MALNDTNIFSDSSLGQKCGRAQLILLLWVRQGQNQVSRPYL